MSAVNRVEFVSGCMSCIILRSRWCHIFVLNVHAPTEDNIGVKNRCTKNLIKFLINLLGLT
jgi:hypothetical protein